MAFCGEALAAASSEPLPLPGNHMQGQVNGLQGAGHHYPGGRKKRILKQYVNGGLGTSCTDSKATTREINGVRGRGAYFYNKVNRSVFIPPDIQIGKDAVVSPRWSFLSSSTRDVCNARQPDKRENWVTLQITNSIPGHSHIRHHPQMET